MVGAWASKVSTGDFCARLSRAALFNPRDHAKKRPQKALRLLGFYMPSLGIITVASLVAADRVLIPVQAQHFALKGLVSLFKSVNQVKRRINSRLDIDGIVLTMVDKRTNLSKDVCAALRSAYGHALKIYRAEIPVSTRTAESAASTHSVLTYDANGPASLAYKALAKEVTENERVRQQHQSALAR